jgi:hypothetical protein
MLDLPWVEGGTWTCRDTQRRFRQRLAHFAMIFRTTATPDPAHPPQAQPGTVWHFHLLAQLANEHYIAKLRARELQQVSYLRAIHETALA